MNYCCYKKIKITNELGIHARPAALIASLANKAISQIYIEKDGIQAEASSVMDILTLFCPKNTEITIGISDEADSKILDEIVKLIETDFRS